MGRRRSDAARRPRRVRILLGSVTAMALVSSLLSATAVAAAGRSSTSAVPTLPASAASAAHVPLAGSNVRIQQSLRPTRIDARAAARQAVTHPRRAVAKKPFHRTPNLHAAARVSATGDVPLASSRVRVSRSPTPRVVGTISTQAVAQPTPVISTAFAGITEHDALAEPPDPWIAVSPTYVVQTTNNVVRVSTRAGVTVLTEPTWALFAVPPDRGDTDPRILWDTIHNRWVGSVATFNGDGSANSLRLAVSDTADPTGAWNIYNLEFLNLFPDFPGISTSSTRIVLTSNDFDGSTFIGATFIEANWSDILAGTSIQAGGIRFTDGATFDFRPAILLSAATNTPMIFMNGANVGYTEVTGTPSAPALVATIDLSSALGLAAFTLPPPPTQPGNVPITDAVDGRPTDAVYSNGTLWFVATADRFDGANHWDAARWTWIRTTTSGSFPTLASDRISAVSGKHLFMPGIGLNRDGSVFFVATKSDPVSTYPTTVLGGVMVGSPIMPLTDLETSSTSYTGSRWGDYVGVATDPSGNGAVWVEHELVAGDGTWRTSVVRVVSDGVAPSAPGAVTQSIVNPQTLTDAVSVRTSWGAATDADSGIRGYLVQISTDGGPFVGAVQPGTTSTHQLLVGHSYRYRIQAIDVVGLMGPATFGPLYRPMLYQSTSSTTYSGTWATQSSSLFSGGSTRFSSTAGAAATFTAASVRGIAVVVTQATTRGSFKVYVDGVLKATVSSAASPTIYRRMLFQFAWATAGTHSVKVVVSGTAGHPRVDVDAFVALQ
jgi:hypothetical protein